MRSLAAESVVRNTLGPFLHVQPHEVVLDAEFRDLGFDSILVMQLAAALERDYGIRIEPAAFFELTTPQQLVEVVASETARRPEAPDGLLPARANGDVPARDPAALPRPALRRPPERVTAPEPVAIIGLAGVYPEAPDLEAFWTNLEKGADCIREVPADRWPLGRYFHPDRDTAIASGRSYGKWGGFIAGAYDFDPLFFHISPREVDVIHPESRRFLQCAWHLLEDAGYTPGSLSEERVGVFVGASKVGVAEQHHTFFTIPNRVSYALNLRGPSLAIDTACSSSLVAIHVACQHIYAGDCTMAIAGGVNLYTHPHHYADLSKLQMLSPDGRCRAFGAGANGFVPGEGIGAILLKPLSMAERDGDHVYAVIRGSATNHGGRTNGFTVPNPRAHREVIEWALDRAGMSARAITYVEAHGTGTDLGDPIEIRGLTEAFARETGDSGYCRIGSVKSNIGHLEAAAGIAGVTKIVLQMQQGRYAPSLHAADLNPRIDFAATPFVVQQRAEEWLPRDAGGRPMPRAACVSSFGAGGSNAHVILQEHTAAGPAGHDEPAPGDPCAFVLSARTEAQLRAYARSFLAFVRTHPGMDVRDVCYTAQVGREPMDHRLACAVESIDRLRDALDRYVAGDAGGPVLTGSAKRHRDAVAMFQADEDACSLLHTWLRKRNVARLCDLWVKGLDIDWRPLHAASPRRRLTLPVYPFSRERFDVRIAETVVPDAGSHAPGPSGSDPRPPDRHVERWLTGDEPFLRDHLVHGRKVLPGVAYLEMARAALAEMHDIPATEPHAIRLRNVVWVRPLVIADAPVVLRISAMSGDEGVTAFEMRSVQESEERSVLHAQGQALIDRAAPRAAVGFQSGASIDIRAAEAACDRRTLTAAGVYRLYESIGMSYGPSHRGIVAMHVGRDEVLARLALPASVGLSTGDCVLHPGLLDSAVQAAIGLAIDRGEPITSLPFCLDEVVIDGACPSEGWVLVTCAPGRGAGSPAPTCDIQICDDDGAVRVVLKGLSTRPGAIGESEGAPDVLLLCPDWTAEPAVTSADAAFGQHVVVLCELDRIAPEDVQETLQRSWGNASVTCTAFHGSAERVDLRYASHAERLVALLAGILQAKPAAS
ncbi:MAG: beta-ketoacyl synthase N-terminal-like domain-containing protein, partial [Vicinamibacterales bacterium]